MTPCQKVHFNFKHITTIIFPTFCNKKLHYVVRNDFILCCSQLLSGCRPLSPIY